MSVNTVATSHTAIRFREDGQTIIILNANLENVNVKRKYYVVNDTMPDLHNTDMSLTDFKYCGIFVQGMNCETNRYSRC
jgi:hypothetical protein